MVVSVKTTSDPFFVYFLKTCAYFIVWVRQIGRNDGLDQLGIKMDVNLNVFNVIEMGDLLDNNFKNFPTEGGRFKHIWANQKQLELLTGEREVNEVGFVLEHDKATLCRTCYTTAH